MRQVVGGESESNWLQDVAKNYPEFVGTFMPVSQIKYAESKKGYLVKVDVIPDLAVEMGESPVFCFLWANSPAGKLLKDFLVESYRVFCDPGLYETYPKYFVEFTTSKNPRVGIDDLPYEETAFVFPSDELAPGQEMSEAVVKKSQASSSQSRKGSRALREPSEG